jgi:hypothetical protein
MIEAYPYIIPEGLKLDYSLPPETVIVLPEAANARLTSILSRYNRSIPDWNSERAYYVSKRRNFPFATIYFDREYPLGGYITSSRWDIYDSPYQAYAIPPKVDFGYAGCWWFRTKERLQYAALRNTLAAQAWEILKDKDGSSPWAIFLDELDPEFVETASKLNNQLGELRKTDANLETTFPLNPEELDPEAEVRLHQFIYGTSMWYTNPYVFDHLEKIMKQYQKNVLDLIFMLSAIYNHKHIRPWLTICLEREHDLTAYLLDDCRFEGHELNILTYTEDYYLTPAEFGSHFPCGIFYFLTKKEARKSAEKSSIMNRWWEQVKDLREDRGWMIAPSEDLSEYEESDIFALPKKSSDSYPFR